MRAAASTSAGKQQQATRPITILRLGPRLLVRCRHLAHCRGLISDTALVVSELALSALHPTRTAATAAVGEQQPASRPIMRYIGLTFAFCHSCSVRACCTSPVGANGDVGGIALCVLLLMRAAASTATGKRKVSARRIILNLSPSTWSDPCDVECMLQTSFFPLCCKVSFRQTA